MSAINDGGPAFPWEDMKDTQGCSRPHHGMSLRDYAIVHFMAAEIACNGMEGNDPQLTATMAEENADAMLAARERKGESL